MATLYQRSGRYYLDYSVNGQRVRKSVGRDRKIAEIRSSELCYKLSNGDIRPKRPEIPIGDELLIVLEQHTRKSKKTGKKDYVFVIIDGGKSHNMLRNELIKIAKIAGLEDMTKVHTLRHTFASRCVMAGVDLPTVQKLMGHSCYRQSSRTRTATTSA